MQQQITEMIEHMAKSQEKMADILEAKRYVITHLASLSQDIPHHNPNFGELSALMEHSLLVTKSVTSYLNSLADFEEALASNLEYVMKEVEEKPGEE